MKAWKQVSYALMFAAATGTATLLTGCGGGTAETSAPVAVQPANQSLKQLLEPIAASGTVGSAGQELEQAAASNPEHKAAIEELIKADGNPAAVKEKTNALLETL